MLRTSPDMHDSDAHVATMPETGALDEVRGPTVLLAEDDLAQRSLYTRILISAGYYVLGVDNGRDALSAARAERPGVILMDVGIPGMDGWSVARELKRDPETASIPILIMSGQFAPPPDWRSQAADCDTFLPKPISVRHLLGTIAAILPPAARMGRQG